MTVFSQNSQDSTRSENPIQDLKVYKYSVKEKNYVMFSAEDYRKALSVGREYAILLNIKDSIEVKFKKVDASLNMYIALVDNLQELNEKQDIEITYLNNNFTDFTYATQKKLEKLTNENEDLKKKNSRLLKSTFIVSEIALIQAVIIVIQIK